KAGQGSLRRVASSGRRSGAPGAVRGAPPGHSSPVLPGTDRVESGPRGPEQSQPERSPPDVGAEAYPPATVPEPTGAERAQRIGVGTRQDHPGATVVRGIVLVQPREPYHFGAGAPHPLEQPDGPRIGEVTGVVLGVPDL